MQSVPREWLVFLREQYPKDSRIRLTEMGADPRPLPPGSTGKLDFIDDAGQFHVKWDNGRTLALVLGKDRFSIYPPEPQTLKLYMPITADFYGRDEWGDMSEYGEEWDGRTLMDHEGSILSALVKNWMPEEAERGLMRWYDEGDSVDHKVRSAVFTVEARDGRLWGVAECRVAGELTPAELTTLKEHLSGQASDGWGEGFEQRPIEVDGGELYVHLWQPDGWSIQTEQDQFAAKVAEGLPELCFSTLKTTGQLIRIKRGETGYYPSEWDTGDKEQNVELADELNEKLGVSPIQRQAMEVGSMAGWDVPGADPAKYQEDYPPYNEVQARELIDCLRGIAPYVVIDCGSYIANDILSAVALMEADSVLRLANADLKSISYLSSQLPLLRDAKWDTDKQYKTASNVKPQQAGDHMSQALGTVAFTLPHSAELEGQYLAGNLLADLSMKDSRVFRKEIEKIAREVFGC